MSLNICVFWCRDSADRVVNGKGKYEELMVCSQEIAASTAQLVVASKVKAGRGSENLQYLADASKGVTSATGKVVASAKSAVERIEEIGRSEFFVTFLGTTKAMVTCAIFACNYFKNVGGILGVFDLSAILAACCNSWMQELHM